MSLKAVFLFLASLFSLGQCNLWDNIFGKVNSPNIEFPRNFSLTLNYKNVSDILIEGSIDLGVAKLELVDKNRIYILNMTQNYLYIIKDDECTIQNLNTDLLKSDQASPFNKNTFWNLFTYYKGKDKKGNYNFELGDLGKYKIITSKIRIMLNSKKGIEEVVIEDEKNPIILTRKENLHPKKFEKDHFLKEISKVCTFDKIDNSNVDETIEAEIKKFLPFKIGNNN